jgi:hypothetical protein
MADPIREEQPASTEQPQEPPSMTLPWWERELSPDERRQLGMPTINDLVISPTPSGGRAP